MVSVVIGCPRWLKTGDILPGDMGNFVSQSGSQNGNQTLAGSAEVEGATVYVCMGWVGE